MDKSIQLYEDGKKKKKIKSLIITIVEVLVVIGLAYLLVHVCLMKTGMNGSSMEPTLNDGDKVIVNSFIYRFTSPKFGDVILFKQDDEEHNYGNIKRVIAVPGDTIQIMDGDIWINGSKVQETIVTESMHNAGLASEPITLEEEEYFVLGDNRNNSEDSRFANVGIVTKNSILGKVWLLVEPEFDFISQRNKNLDIKEEEGE